MRAHAPGLRAQLSVPLLLFRRSVELAAWNALTTVHVANGDLGRATSSATSAGARFIHFIPIIERVAEAAEDGRARGSRGDRPLYVQEGDVVTGRSASAARYGRFLIDVFEEWVRRDVGTVYVQMFNVRFAATAVVHNDPCTCGSGRKWKRCHGAELSARAVAAG